MEASRSDWPEMETSEGMEGRCFLEWCWSEPSVLLV